MTSNSSGEPVAAPSDSVLSEFIKSVHEDASLTSALESRLKELIENGQLTEADLIKSKIIEAVRADHEIGKT